MPQSPAALSPHRFLPPREPHTARPQSSLRQTSTLHTPAVPKSTKLQFTQIAHSATPSRRFVFPSSQNPTEPTPWSQTPRPARKLQRVESIEEGSLGSSPLEAISHFISYEDVAQTVEHEQPLGNGEEEAEEELLFNPENHKRRRISPPSSPPKAHRRSISDSSTFQPQTPAPPSHRFLPSRTPGPSTVTMAAPLQPTITRPTFIVPTKESAHATTQPLPDTFSPQRRGHKFVPRGLAATAMGWILEVAHTSNTSHVPNHSTRNMQDDGVRVKMRLLEVRSGDAGEQGQDEVEAHQGGMILVRGRTDPTLYNASRAGTSSLENGVQTQRDVHVVLVGRGGKKDGTKVRVAGVVGIKAPCWDVEVDGVKWIVGIEWVAL